MTIIIFYDDHTACRVDSNANKLVFDLYTTTTNSEVERTRSNSTSSRYPKQKIYVCVHNINRL